MNNKFIFISLLEFAEENLTKANEELVNLISKGEIMVNGELDEANEEIKILEVQIASLNSKLESIRKIDKARQDFIQELEKEKKNIEKEINSRSIK